MRFIVIIALLTALSGCSRLNCTPVGSMLGGDINLVKLGYEIGDQLITSSQQPLIPGDSGKPVLTVTFVNNDNLNVTSPFGRSLQNHVSSRFVQQGFTVREVKLRKDLFIRKQSGEFMLSRDLTLINERQNAQAVVVGTYSVTADVMYLSIRLVNPTTKSVLATFDKRLCLDDTSLQMLGLQRGSGWDEIPPPRKSILNRILY